MFFQFWFICLFFTQSMQTCFLLFISFQISQGFVEQLHRGKSVEVQPQAAKVSQPGSQGPPALHQRGNICSNAGKECYLLGLSGRGDDFITKTKTKHKKKAALHT